MTASLTAVTTTFSARTYELIFGERKSSLSSIEFTAIVPVHKDGAGVLIEGIGAKGHAPAWRAAIVLAVKKQN